MILPNLIIDKSTDRLRPVRAFGYCDFAAELTESTEQVQCPTEQLPVFGYAGSGNMLDCCLYDSETKNIICKDAL